jgi:hypothetical protein
LFEARSTP